MPRIPKPIAMTLLPAEPITDAEIDELYAFLASDACGRETMPIDALHGFLTALDIGPDSVMPGKWWPQIWGPNADDEPNWKNDDQYIRVLQLVIGLSNDIVEMMESNPDEFEPLLFDIKHHGVTYVAAEQWAAGFLRGTKFCEKDYAALSALPDGKALEPIAKLAKATFWVTPAGYLKNIKNRQKLAVQIPASVAAIYRYFMPIRQARLDRELRLEKAERGGRQSH